jgi:septal ring factor EnvC (AmiA/AmiB activator)
VLVTLAAAASLAAQTPEGPAPDAQARRVNQRIRALQSEAARLAGQSRSLVVELRKLEIERELRVEEARQAERALADSRQALQATTDRLAALEKARVEQLPDLEVQLVDLYKRGRSGYARMLFGASGIRELARATRAVAALVDINERRIADHQRTLDALREERSTLAQTTRDLQTRETAAIRARTAAERAVAAHGELITRLDSRRDLAAQYVGELQLVYDRLQQQMSDMAAGRPVNAVALPLAPFRGALDWPIAGDVTGRFGQTSGRLGGTAVRNGIEIAAAEGAVVRAVHGGTIGYADAFTGFGTLVIVDHGANNYSLYGYLSEAHVERGHTVESGAELGRAGLSPAGPPALYFEVRIDGRPVDPLQWLEAR